jgi:hypothetical protein
MPVAILTKKPTKEPVEVSENILYPAEIRQIELPKDEDIEGQEVTNTAENIQPAEINYNLNN